jgi:AraC-like DNA-binding protein
LLWAVRQTWNAGQGRTYQPSDATVFWLVEAGRMQATIDGGEYIVQAGEAFLQSPAAIRELKVLETVQWVSVGLRSQTRLHDAEGPCHWRPQAEEWAALLTAFEQIRLCRNSRSLAGRWRFEGALRLLLGLCLEQAPKPVFPTWLQSALTRIEAQPQTDLAALAAESGYSPTQFRVRFRQYLGVAPADYAAQCLAARAYALVTETNWPVKRIAAELDFAAATHFCRFFKRRFGLSPTEIRHGEPLL